MTRKKTVLWLLMVSFSALSGPARSEDELPCRQMIDIGSILYERAYASAWYDGTPTFEAMAEVLQELILGLSEDDRSILRAVKAGHGDVSLARAVIEARAAELLRRYERNDERGYAAAVRDLAFESGETDVTVGFRTHENSPSMHATGISQQDMQGYYTAVVPTLNRRITLALKPEAVYDSFTSRRDYFERGLRIPASCFSGGEWGWDGKFHFFAGDSDAVDRSVDNDESQSTQTVGASGSALVGQ